MKRRVQYDGHSCLSALERLARFTPGGEWDQDRAKQYAASVQAAHDGCPLCSRTIPGYLLPKTEVPS